MIKFEDKHLNHCKHEKSRRKFSSKFKATVAIEALKEQQTLAAYFERAGDTLKLKIALTKKRRKWFVGLWDHPIELKMKIPTA